ncbi:conserved hypothetical protein [Leishmania infantum JPCM5]|uniref:Intraflagellar_transport_protein_43_-_putative n=2 Tax=Leishmania infantum TaxID=5671 RepID=A0A6L0XSA8_LEIIN|nr:conserved hypothetical protein [Leishmania infantum JPCM5]CAC9500380.1 Intraflagellar_transport_protein_43_-_putative [Leishmania infantum]CAM69156.1 conserved hypothetical protein [Leishmania infantum JPCM5]SUZ43095.1 Intraflagellar_transport_protein_43_-_putative [Leishmania infantum]|eukprot:XP_001466436.1 conserved hypothetical protein [Leishmania infantum JPCM5]
MASTGNGGGSKAAASSLSPQKAGMAAPLTSAPPMTASTTSPSRLNSMRTASSSVSSKNAPTGPSKKGGTAVKPSPEVDGKTAAGSSEPGPRASVNTDHQSKSNANSVNASNVAGSTNAPSDNRPDHDRRGRRQEGSSWFDVEKPANAHRPADKELNENVQIVQDDIPDAEQAHREQAERAQRQKEKLAQHISESPTGFQATLPRLNELDVTNSWDKLLRMMRSEFDMSCLTSCLARELDEDVAWNPEMLLVQLTSDMLDAAELQKDGGEAYVPVDASDIGQMTGGEVARKRKEKRSTITAAGAAPAAGAAEGTEREPEKGSEKPAAASPTPAFQAAASKALRKQTTTDPAAAAPSGKKARNTDNAGSTSTANSSSTRKRSAAGSRSGEAGGGGGNNANVSSSTAKCDSTDDTKSTKSTSLKAQVSKLFSK